MLALKADHVFQMHQQLRETNDINWQDRGAYRKGRVEGDQVKTIVHRLSGCEVTKRAPLILNPVELIFLLVN